MTKPTDEQIADVIERMKVRIDEEMHNGGYPREWIGCVAALEWATGREDSLPSIHATRPFGFNYFIGESKHLY